MENQKFIKIFKTKSNAPAIPDLSAYTDDILGPSMSDPITEVPEKIRMLKRKRKVAPFLEPLLKGAESEEENEEGKLDSEIDAAPEPPKLSNHEQGLQHGFNPNEEQVATKWEHFKKVAVTDIPRIISAGVDTRSPIAPEFHQINTLPDYIKNPMRALEKQLFKLITSTPIDDIQVIANVRGQGPNSEEEVDAVEDWIRHTGRVDHELIKDIENRISGLELIHSEGISHLLVNNSAGRFIFNWPTVDNQVSKRTE